MHNPDALTKYRRQEVKTPKADEGKNIESKLTQVLNSVCCLHMTCQSCGNSTIVMRLFGEVNGDREREKKSSLLKLRCNWHITLC